MCTHLARSPERHVIRRMAKRLLVQAENVSENNLTEAKWVI
jgi:hypothetical protein